jgi:tRNA(Ile)-lysidine synthase
VGYVGIWDLGFGIWDLTSALHQQVRRTIRRHALCPPGTALLVGLSGGSDSVALTLLLRDLAEHGRFRLTGLAHLNHQLRPTADADEQFCRELAKRLALPFVAESADVRGYAEAQRLSLEDAARRVRYEFLTRAAARTGADRIAVGHTQDDQAETFLLKLIRGAGLTGLGGIFPRRDNVVRPLLDVSRADLRRFLEQRGESWVEDETNADEANPRNRVRHRVIPELDRTCGGATRPAIARAAALVREDAQWLDELADRRFRDLAVATEDGLEIDGALLGAEPAPVRRRLLLRALRSGSGGREVGLDHVEAAEAVLEGTAGGADVPGGRMELRRGKLVLVQQGMRSK